MTKLTKRLANEMGHDTYRLGHIPIQLQPGFNPDKLQAGNIIRRCFDLGVGQGLGDFVHHSIRAVAAFAAAPIEQLRAQVSLVLAAIFMIQKIKVSSGTLLKVCSVVLFIRVPSYS
jgi:hypothetical protein